MCFQIQGCTGNLSYTISMILTYTISKTMIVDIMYLKLEFHMIFDDGEHEFYTCVYIL